ncbi:MAG: NDP-sugar synthase [Acidobacteriota bacterium]
MKGMILAAGLGERMRPLTFMRAKSSLPLFNRPFIVHAAEYLKRFGINEVAVNLHHRPDSIRSILKDGSDLNISISYSHEERILGTAGGVRKIEKFFDGKRFILLNSDFISDVNLEKAIEHHESYGALATLVVMRSTTDGYSRLLIDEEWNVRAIAEGKGDHIFCGIHILEPEILDRIPEGERLDIIRDTYRDAMEKRLPIKAFEHQGFWFEFGDLSKYLQGHIQLAGTRLEFIQKILNVPETGQFQYSGGSCLLFSTEDVMIDEEVRLSGMVVGDRGCRVEREASISNSILHRHSVIRRGASLSKCIVGEGVIIPDGMKLHGVAISTVPADCIHVIIPEDIHRKGDLLIKQFLS